jgi:hypothetical protein
VCKNILYFELTFTSTANECSELDITFLSVQSFDECVKLRQADCDPENMWLQIPFFCGHAAECWYVYYLGMYHFFGNRII